MTRPGRAGRRRRLLVLACYPERAAATRFRACAYFPWWRSANIDVELDSFVDDAFLRDFYSKGRSAMKALGLALAAVRRLATGWRGRHFDAVFVQRGAALLGPPLLEVALARGLGLPMVFDFDDAIWLDVHDRSQHPLAARLLKNPGKTDALIRNAAHVTAGSEYLAVHARRINPETSVVRTVVSKEQWHPLPGRLDGEIVSGGPVPMLGWVGTHSTARQLDMVLPALQELARRGHRFKVRLVGARRTLPIAGIEVESIDWQLDREVQDFQRIDIGLAPMFNDAWSRGKCGFKQLQYMAVGVPMVASAEGGASEFLVHAENALVPQSHGDWVTQIEQLLVDRELRARLSRTGRQLVERRYCLEQTGPAMASLVSELMDRDHPASLHEMTMPTQNYTEASSRPS